MLVTRDVFQEQMLSELSGSMLLRVQSCNKLFSHLMTDFPQTGTRQLIILHFIYLSSYFYMLRCLINTCKMFCFRLYKGCYFRFIY